MEAAGVITILAVVLIVLALVYYLVSVILALRKITAGLDEAIASVGEIVEKSAPVNDVVTTINEQLDAGVDLREGLLVKKAGLTDAVGLVDEEGKTHGAVKAAASTTYGAAGAGGGGFRADAFGAAAPPRATHPAPRSGCRGC